MPYSGAPFQGKGGARRLAQQSKNPCFTFNKGLHYDCRSCRYQHKCQRCGAGHPEIQCPRFRQASTGMFLPLPSATLYSKQQLLPSPVSPLFFNHVLQGYDNNKSQYLTHGFTQGFRIGCINLPNTPQLLATNLKSAFAFPEVIDAKISKEIKLGRILGPSRVPPKVHKFRVSPTGVVPKSTPGEYRVTHHLSHTQGSSVNDGIPHKCSSVQYATVQDAIAFIIKSPHTIFLGKLDIQAAFRIIPVHGEARSQTAG